MRNKKDTERLNKLFGKDENYVGKRESINLVLTLSKKVDYLMYELFKMHSTHEFFRNIDESVLIKLRKLRFNEWL